MKKLIRNYLATKGYLIISRKALRKHPKEEISNYYGIEESSIPYLKSAMNGGLKEKLIQNGKTKWLEVGCGGTFDDNFTYIDLFPETLVNKKGKYHRIDIINLTESDVTKLGKFDLIRMQHVFEHFTPEDGLKVLGNCAKLLNHDGYILITSPDLMKHISLYLSGTIRNDFEWAHRRISSDSPNSFYFSVYAHSMRFEEHKWCYDAEGLIYQLKQSGRFNNIIEVKLGDELANIPFTHNRPKEDVCVIGQLIST
jgi:predicted SAM-dependent methyltransferase